MDVERLRILRELADRGTLTATATALSLTPSAVSQQLKTLQKETGVALLEPDGRRVRLTDAGRTLVARTDEVLAALDRAEADMDSYRTTPRGSVRVAMFPSGAAMLLACLITQARAVGIEVIGRDIDRPAADAPEILADFDVVVIHRDERELTVFSPRFEVTPLLREPLEMLVPKHHRLAKHDRVALSDLADEPWIGVELGLMVDDVIRSLAAVAGIQPRIVQRVNDFRVVEELVLAGVGVALLPRYALIARKELVRIPLGGVNIARHIEAVTRAGASTQPAVRAVVGILEDITKKIAVKDSQWPQSNNDDV